MTKLLIAPADAGLRKTDADGNRVPAKLSGFQWLGVLFRAGVPRRVIGRQHWVAQSRLDGDCAVVSCPCGEAAAVPLARSPTRCECDRWFFYDGTDVWALLGPKGTPP